MLSTLFVALLATQTPTAAASSPTKSVVSVLLTLSEEPASRVFARVEAASKLTSEHAAAEAKTAAAAQAQRVRQQQDHIIDALAQPRYRASLIYRLDRNTNAIAVRIEAALLPRLRAVAGVTSAQVIPDDVITPKQRPAVRDLSLP